MSIDDFYAVERTMYMNVSDEHEAAEARYLADLARANRPRVQRVCCAGLVWLGKHLIRWGQGLVQRYGPPAPLPERQSMRGLSG
jgi:hypothetical protein